MSGTSAGVNRKSESQPSPSAKQARLPALPVVLAVDDEPHQIDTLRMILKPGFRVVGAHSVDEGLEVFVRERPDSVILDVRMPGKDGLQGLKELREIDPLVSVILLTAYADLDLAREAMRLGASEFMTKPFDIFELHRSVRKSELATPSSCHVGSSRSARDVECASSVVEF